MRNARKKRKRRYFSTQNNNFKKQIQDQKVANEDMQVEVLKYGQDLLGEVAI